MLCYKHLDFVLYLFLLMPHPFLDHYFMPQTQRLVILRKLPDHLQARKSGRLPVAAQGMVIVV